VENKRKHHRIKSTSYCILVDHNGKAYQAKLGDISLGGALLVLDDDTHFKVGDSCDLMMSSYSAYSPMKRPATVVRSESRNIGVTLLG
jgi:c-di-GMP-binding flagellar brake protein YcgR